MVMVVMVMGDGGDGNGVNGIFYNDGMPYRRSREPHATAASEALLLLQLHKMYRNPCCTIAHAPRSLRLCLDVNLGEEQRQRRTDLFR